MIDSPLALVAVLAIIVAAPVALRRMRSSQPHGVRVLSRTAITKTSAVAVITLDERRWLVGSGEHGIQLLAELDAHSPGPPRQASPYPSSLTTAATDRLQSYDVAPAHRPAREAEQQPRDVAEPGDDMFAQRPGIGLVDRPREKTIRIADPRSVRVHHPS